MKILVTGGAGFIGSHLTESLLNKGHKVFIIDDLSTGSLDNLKHLENNINLDVNINTILNFNALSSLINECDTIVHLAAAVGVKYIIENPLSSLITNVKGTENVLEIASYRKKKVIIASTSEVYGKSDNIPFKEDSDRLLGSTTKSRWSYSCAKALDEFLAFAYYREKRLPISIVRFFNTVGDRQKGKYGMVIPRFVQSALFNKPLYIYGDGSQSRCFGYVKDIIKGVEKLILNEAIGVGEIYNLGNDEEITIKELAEKIIKKTNSKSIIEYKSLEEIFGKDFEDMQKRKPDLTKAKQQLSYKVTTSLDEILQKIIDFERFKNDNK